MFKQKLILLFILFFSFNTCLHGFGQNTFISLANHHYQSLDNLCAYKRTKTEYPSVLTYKEKTGEYTKHRIKSLATSKTNCYFAIGFDNNAAADITCTPDQEFYSVTTLKWIPAYQLSAGDELLSKNNTSVAITHIKLVNEPIDVFIIEVKKTHTFFVGRHAVLTHNIILPLGISLSIPFGGVTDGNIGSFFGPVTCTIGILAGTVIGTIIKIFNDDKIPKYRLPRYDISNLHKTNKNEDPQILRKPREEDGYEPPKNWDGQKSRHPKSGRIGWPDNNGNVWVPTKPNSQWRPSLGCPRQKRQNV